MKTKSKTRKLDVWLDRYVVKNQRRYLLMKRGMYYRPHAAGYTYELREAGFYTLEEAKSHEYKPRSRREEWVTIHEMETPCYSTDKALASDILDLCLLELPGVTIAKVESGYWVGYAAVHAVAQTEELAICLFAKMLFEPKVNHELSLQCTEQQALGDASVDDLIGGNS